MIERLLTIQEVATALSVSTQTVYNLHRRGHLPFVQIGRLHRIQESALNHLINPTPAEEPEEPETLPLESESAPAVVMNE